MKLSHIILLISCSLTIFSCTKEQGCTDISSCNFSSTAEEDDGTCIYPADECDDLDASTVNDTISSTCACVGEQSTGSGCMDSTACNYDPNVNTEDNSCLYPDDPCNDNNSNTINDTFNMNCDCVGTSSESGCTDSSACNYDLNANTEDNSCLYTGDPCDDNNSSTLNDVINSNCDCVGTLSGCTDSSACNYDPNANTDDNSCVYPGDPCDDGASNTTNDVFDANCSCQGTLDESNLCLDSDSDGYYEVTFGMFTDNYSEECAYRVFWSEDESVTTDWYNPMSDNTENAAIMGFDAAVWTMEVSDTYGDGKGPNGYYFATCISAVSGDVIFLVNTPFETGYSSTTNFSLGTGLTNPTILDDN
jgi:hypothetical protein